MDKPFAAGDRVRLIYCNKLVTGTIHGTRYYQRRPKGRVTYVADIVLDDGQKCFEAVFKLTLIEQALTARLNRAAPFLLKVLEIVSKELGQCPEGHEHHHLAMLVRATIIKTREE